MQTAALKRSISLPFLVFYGVGTMVGAGFYALMGKVVAEAGMAAPLAFLLTGVLAALSAFSFAELSSRYPVTAGAAQYVREGFGSKTLSSATGWVVITTGVVSAATMTVAAVGFLRDAVAINESLAIVLMVTAMTAIAAWGVGQSVAAVVAITVAEVGALIYVGGMNIGVLAQLPERLPDLWPRNGGGWLGVFSGAFLAFYAFIGFEDMVNMAEEVKDARRSMPIAILISIAATTFLYVSIMLIAILALPPDRLVTSATPVAELVRGVGWMSITGVWLVSLLTGINGALVQIVMAARVAYGMATRGQAATWLSSVHPRTRTPIRATLLMGAVIVALALFFPLTTLARLTSAIILLIFACVNLALWRIKGRDPDPEGDGPRYPRWVPLAGCLVSLAMLAFQGWVLLSG